MVLQSGRGKNMQSLYGRKRNVGHIYRKDVLDEAKGVAGKVEKFGKHGERGEWLRELEKE